MRLDIRYRMHFHYPEPVWESQNEVRVRPRTDDHQRLISHRLTTAPGTRVLSFIDYWGTTVDHIGVREPHDYFEVVAEAAVDVRHRPPVTSEVGVDELETASFRESVWEYLVPSAHVDPSDDLIDRSREVVAGIRSVSGRVDAVVANVHDMLAYESGSSEIGISLTELVKQGAGVCQDFSHLTIAMLRSSGIPARYVSGYLFALDETNLNDAELDDSVTVQTHAWTEAAIPGHGWYAVDPTNQQPVGERHVVIGHGRDYDDVAPVRGVFSGSVEPTVEAEVVMERMGPASRSLVTESPRRPTISTEAMNRQRMQQQQQQQQ